MLPAHVTAISGVSIAGLASEDAGGSPRPVSASSSPANGARAKNQPSDDAQNGIVQRKQRGQRNQKAAERHPLGEPSAADQALPLPQDDNGREPPENRA
jgi:hypothetical protein